MSKFTLMIKKEILEAKIKAQKRLEAAIPSHVDKALNPELLGCSSGEKVIQKVVLVHESYGARDKRGRKLGIHIDINLVKGYRWHESYFLKNSKDLGEIEAFVSIPIEAYFLYYRQVRDGVVFGAFPSSRYEYYPTIVEAREAANRLVAKKTLEYKKKVAEGRI